MIGARIVCPNEMLVRVSLFILNRSTINIHSNETLRAVIQSSADKRRHMQPVIHHACVKID